MRVPPLFTGPMDILGGFSSRLAYNRFRFQKVLLDDRLANIADCGITACDHKFGAVDRVIQQLLRWRARSPATLKDRRRLKARIRPEQQHRPIEGVRSLDPDRPRC